ncbi:hypothetical protein RhiirC2_657574, partial [Rhizophagus irregularis]
IFIISKRNPGIAILLLPGSRIAHSCFKIPFEIHEDSTCTVKYGSNLALFLQVIQLIIWNEVSMVH